MRINTGMCLLFKSDFDSNWLQNKIITFEKGGNIKLILNS